jgi:hypothetical protein
VRFCSQETVCLLFLISRCLCVFLCLSDLRFCFQVSVWRVFLFSGCPTCLGDYLRVILISRCLCVCVYISFYCWYLF